MCRTTCDWLGDHPTGGSNFQDSDWVDLWPESTGTKTPAVGWHKYWRGWDYFPRVEGVNALPRSTLPSPYTCSLIGGSFVIHGHKGSLGSHHEWMSPWCRAPWPTADTVPAAWLVLVAPHGSSDAEGSSCKQCIQQYGIHAKAPMWPIIVTAPLELLHVDVTSIETTIELDQPPNMASLLVFCDNFTKHIMAYMTPQWNCENCCPVSVASLHLNLQSTSQAPEWMMSQFWKQHHQRALQAYGHMKG